MLGCHKASFAVALGDRNPEPLTTHGLQWMFCGQGLLPCLGEAPRLSPFANQLPEFLLSKYLRFYQLFLRIRETPPGAALSSPTARRTCGWCSPPARCNPPQTHGYSRRSSSPGQASTGNTSPAQNHGEF